jgi:hypothetical protein
MSLHIHFTCLFENCPYSKKIVVAPKSIIIKHLTKHDYTQSLQLAVDFRIIDNVTDRRSPYWLSEQLLNFFINQVDYR